MIDAIRIVERDKKDRRYKNIEEYKRGEFGELVGAVVSAPLENVGLFERIFKWKKVKTQVPIWVVHALDNKFKERLKENKNR